MSVTTDGDNITVTGNTCAKGGAYAKKGDQPDKIVTSVLLWEDGTLTRASVKTEKDIPKGRYLTS